jgi:uncharacterized membrane protein
MRPVWVLPLLSGILLAASVTVYELPGVDFSAKMRGVSIALIGVLVAANAISLGLLVRGVFVGSALSAGRLLLVGVALWVVNVAVFALAYWEIDGNGPELRAKRRYTPDLVFPQQSNQDVPAEGDWRPTFSDYLYVSLTAGTAFSPTDAMPFTHRAKLIMGIQSTMSFVIVAMLVSRAINIARG